MHNIFGKIVWQSPLTHAAHTLRRQLSTTFLLLSACVISMGFPGQAESEELLAVSDVWTPFVIVSDDQFSGIGVDIVTEIAERTGDTITIQYAPTKRALKMFEHQEVDMMVLDSPLWNDPNQTETFTFSDDIMTVQEYLYMLTENAIEVTSPADLRGKTVDIMMGYYYPVFEDAFQDGTVTKAEVKNETSLLKKLVSKRTDAICMDSIAFQYTIRALGYAPDLFTQGLQLSDTTLGIKLRAEKAEVLPRFNEAIAAMKADGTIDRIIARYTE